MNAATVPPDRRKTDALVDDAADEEILRLIRESTDDSHKSTLMVLFQINRNSWRTSNLLADVVARIEAQDRMFEQHRAEFSLHRDELAKHMHDEALLFSKGIGAWRAVSIVGIAVVSLGSYILSGHLGDMREIQQTNTAQGRELSDLRQQINLMSDAFTKHIIVGREPVQGSPGQHGLRLPER